MPARPLRTARRAPSRRAPSRRAPARRAPFRQAGFGITLGGFSADPDDPRAALIRNRAALARTRLALLGARLALAAVVTILAVSAAVSLAAETIQAAVRYAGKALWALVPARIRAAAKAADRAVTPVVLSLAGTAQAFAAGLSVIIPARARAAVAAAAVLALATAATAAATALGPAAIAGPAGPAIAAAAINSAPAAAGPVRAGPDRTGHLPGWSARPAGRALDLSTWHAITEAAAGHPRGGALAPAQKLLPAGLHGAQASMVITPARAANAALITERALRLHMGIRSAVIAVATAMQESTLENLSYGDRDSLGLFQQRPSAGWGTPAQITNPAYAADAFLRALAAYQAHDRVWARQPLWEAAQGVQRSAFPTAYAQWEDQAAHIVANATRHLL